MIGFALMLLAQDVPPGESCRHIVPPMTSAALVEAEHRRSEAIAGHKKYALFDLYDPGFRGVTNTGAEVDKMTLLGLFERVDPGMRFMLEKLEGIPLGSAAVSRGVLVAKRGETVVSRTAFLHVWRIKGCRWQIVAGASTPIPPGN